MAKVPESNWRIAPEVIEPEGTGFEQPDSHLTYSPTPSAMPGSGSSMAGSSGSFPVITILLVLAGVAVVAFGLGKVLGFF